MSRSSTRLGLFWYARYQVARGLIALAMRVMPASRYRTELNAALWGLAFRVQAHNAAVRAAQTGATDIV